MMHQRFAAWMQGAPIASMNSEDVEASEVPNEGEVEDGQSRVEDDVNVVPAPVQ